MSETAPVVYKTPEVGKVNPTEQLLTGLKAKYPDAFDNNVPFGWTKGVPLGVEVPEEYRRQYTGTNTVNANHLLFAPEGVFHVTAHAAVAIDPMQIDLNPILDSLGSINSTTPTTISSGEGAQRMLMTTRKVDFGNERDKSMVSLVLRTTNETNPPKIVQEITTESLLNEL